MATRVLRASRAAVSETTKELERAFEDATRGAVPGKLWQAWASRVYLNVGEDPAGIVYVKGARRTRGAMAFWTQPGTVRNSTDGEWLAIPLAAAGARGRNRLLTPGDWMKAHPGVQLKLIYRPGGKGLLVAEGVLSGNGTFRPQTDIREAGRKGLPGRKLATVPLFALIRQLPFRNSVSLKGIFDRHRDRLADAFVEQLGKN